MSRVAWNKGLKGVQVPWNKGKKLPFQIWNKGKKLPYKVWNAGTKGIVKPNKTTFKKGQIPHNKGMLGNCGSFSSIHEWIKQKLGQPKYCEHCKKSDRKLYEWANKEHTYKKTLQDWMRLCRGCHMKYDYKFNNRKGR